MKNLIESKALEVTKNLGSEKLIDYCEKNSELNNFEDKSMISIGYNNINDRFPGDITIDEKVYKYLQEEIKPYFDKKLEVPFILIGEYFVFPSNVTIIINKIIGIKKDTDLSAIKCAHTEENIIEVENLLAREDNKFVAFGHTHPLVISDDRLQISKYKKLSDYVENWREDLGLREKTMNPSIQDIFQLIAFYLHYKSINNRAIIMSCIYHNNEELNFVEYDGKSGLKLASNVYHVKPDKTVEEVKNFNNMKREVRKWKK